MILETSKNLSRSPITSFSPHLIRAWSNFATVRRRVRRLRPQSRPGRAKFGQLFSQTDDACTTQAQAVRGTPPAKRHMMAELKFGPTYTGWPELKSALRTRGGRTEVRPYVLRGLACQMSTATEVLAVLAGVLDTREVYDAPDLPLYELELLDSLRTVELILALSDRFGLEISPAEIDRECWASPRRIAEDIERRLGAPRTGNPE